jgi:hypothetical protein
MKEIQDEGPALQGQRRIVARAYIAKERVSRIEFVPGEVCAGFVETGFDEISPFERDMWVLPPPDMQQLAFDLGGPVQRIVVFAFA